MPRNSSGVYTLPAGNPVVPGTTIDAAWANDTLEDLANEVTNSLSRTGAGGMLAPFRIADGTVTAPGISFLTETNSGFYRAGTGSITWSILGVPVANFSTVGFTIPFGKALTAQGNATVGGTLGVTGPATFSSTIALTGALTASGGVLGNVTAASGTSTFNDVVINGALDMTAGSSATITGLNDPTSPSEAANKNYVDNQVATRLALTGGTMSGAIAMGNNKVTGLATPTADTDATTKLYVDSVAQGLDVKASCRAATTGNITLSGTQTIDGVAVIAGDRVLVKDQSSAAQNGIYVASAGSWSRSSDMDVWAEFPGAFVFVEDGTTNDNSGWVCTVAPGGTLGTTPVTFEQFSGAGQINAGTGMTKTGNTLNVNTASSSRIVVGADEIDLATTGVTAGTYKSVTVDQWGRITGGTNPTTLAGYGITNAYTTTQVDSALALKLNLTGGTMSGAIAMGANKITGLGDPTLAQDAATKNYIDTIFGSTTTAAASAAAAASSATSAASSASSASTSASNAAGSATSALSYLNTFRGQYIGAASSDPTVDGNGNALTAGDLYFNTTASEMRVYSGSAWVAAYLPAAGYLALTGGTMTGTINFAAGQTIAGYLTTASASATYQTIAGMSAYLTSASAASTYLALTGGTMSGAITFASSQTFDATKLSGNLTYDGSTLSSVSSSAYYPQFVQRNSTNDANAGYLVLDKVRGAAIVQNGDVLGNLVFRGYDGSAYLQGAYINAVVSATPGTNDMPVDLVFGTTPDGSAGPSERMRITQAGTLKLSSNYQEGVVTANTGTAYTIASANGTVQILTLTGNCTFTFPTAVSGQSFTLLLKQDATGSRTATWPAAVKWPGGTAPTITSTASKLDKYVFTSDGTNWYGSNAGQNYTV